MVKAIKEIKEGTVIIAVKTRYPYLAAGQFCGVFASSGEETVEITSLDGESHVICTREKGSKTICGDRAFEISNESSGSTKFFYLDKLQDAGINWVDGISTTQEFYSKMRGYGGYAIKDLYSQLCNIDVKKL